MKSFVTLLLVWSGICAQAQNLYDVEKIPPELLKNTSLVVRMEQQIYEIKSISNAIYTYKTAVTIVNRNAEDQSSMIEFYNRFSSIYNLKAAMYDAKGNKIKDYKYADFKDKSAISDGSVYEDGRIKELHFLNATYPYTIEYSYTKDYTGITDFPSWYPVSSFGSAAEKSEYIFRIPENITFKYLKVSD